MRLHKYVLYSQPFPFKHFPSLFSLSCHSHLLVSPNLSLLYKDYFVFHDNYFVLNEGNSMFSEVCFVFHEDSFVLQEIHYIAMLY